MKFIEKTVLNPEQIIIKKVIFQYNFDIFGRELFSRKYKIALIDIKKSKYVKFKPLKTLKV